MQIQNLNSAVAHFATESDNLRIEADVTIYNGRAAEIQNGRILRTDEEQERIIADFSSYTTANHLSVYHNPDTAEQIAIIEAIGAFADQVRAGVYSLGVDIPQD